jgi:hypothetical protein
MKELGYGKKEEGVPREVYLWFGDADFEVPPI